MRRLATAALALALPLAVAAPAHAREAAGGDGKGYVRLAHLSPDTPEVDVHLKALSGTMKEQVFRGVGYGVMSAYLALPVGGYEVGMAPSKPPGSPVILTTLVTVEPGGAYTVAGVGKYADLGLRVLRDDLSMPPGDQAKVRVIQASVQAPVLGVSLPDGQTIADNVAFATTTAYQTVRPGTFNLVIHPANGRSDTGVQADLAAGNVYSLLILDGAAGALKTELRTDATRDGVVPAGGVATGAGGLAGSGAWPLYGGAALLVLVAAGAAWGIRRRLKTL
ncbi:DUF4397 domain-containing protein [Hamadaea tsunoensis]|uniref:DUF4397 domain-containing protein n=1 Tax=Hamadaea tsunoensis TaxID=53368 RepID=UPI000551BCD4|nr:DUF4397 domain-containing protein [Hamadaea tsunoensis]